MANHLRPRADDWAGFRGGTGPVADMVRAVVALLFEVGQDAIIAEYRRNRLYAISISGRV